MKNIFLSLLVFAFSLKGLSQNYKATTLQTSSKEFRDIDVNGSVSKRLTNNFLNYSLFTLDTKNLKTFARNNKKGKIRFDLSLPNLSSINITIVENDILSDDYKLVVATDNGREVFEKKECITYNGSITDQLENSVRLTLTDDVIHGEIRINDKDYFIEPLQFIVDSKPSTIFVLYEMKDVIDNPLNTCGAIEVEKEIQKASINTNRPGYNCYRVRMAVATDFSAYTALGGTVNNASTHSIAIMNLSAPYFSNSQFNTNVDLVLVGQYISTSLATDPFTCSGCTLTTGIDINTQLPNFGTWAKNGNFGFSFDLAHNITNRYNSGTIGLAYVGSIGMTQYNTGVSSMSSSPTWLTFIHEVGHNFGLSHTFQLGQGTTGGFMDYGDGTINGAYGWNLTYSSTEYENEVYRAANAVPSVWQTRLSSCNVIGATVTDFISNKEIQCIGSSIQFRDNSLGGPTSWSWTFQDGTPATSTDTNPLVSFSTSGIKSVTLITNNGNGTTTKTKNIYVPSSITTAACVNSGVMASTIANDLGPTKFILNTINKSSGGSRTDGNKYFDYMCSDNTVLAANSTYNVTIKNNYASVKFQFFIDYNDDGDFLDANETIYNGDSSSTSGSVTFSFTTPTSLPKINKLLRARILSVPSSFLTTFNSCYNPGEYGQVEDYGVVFECSSPVVPTFTPIATICNGGSITLPTTSTNSISGTWSPAVNNTATTTYTFTPTSGLCASATTLTVNVNPIKTATLSSAAGTNSQTKCLNTAITEISYTTTGATGATFSGLPSGVTGNWTSNTITINGTPSAAGTFNYTLNLTGGCGTVTASGSIVVNAIATATSGGPNTVCESLSPVAFALTGASLGGSATTGAWSIISGGGILSSTAQTATPELVTFTPDANYSGTVTLRLTSNYGTGCSAATTDRVINVVSTPILSNNTGGASTVSINATTPAFANEQAGGIWSIVAGTGTASITSNGVVTGLTAGTVSVVYTYNNNCGTATKSNTITVISSITGVISGNATICAGTPTQLSISLTGKGPWFGTLSDGTGFSGGDNPLLVTVNPTINTTYTIATLSSETATASEENLSGSASVTVNQPTIERTVATSCGMYIWDSGNHSDYMTSGTYSYIENCVEHILELTVNQPTIETTVATSCGMYIWDINGSNYMTTGTYSYIENCVEHILELTVNQPTIERTVATSCGMYIWDINGSDFMTTGTYSYIENCVEHILELTVNQPTIETTVATSCGMYIWDINGSDYMTTGTYSYIENCVEHILELTVNQPTIERTVATSCGMYIWETGNLSDYFETGTYSYIENCVEHILELTVNQPTIETTVATSCGMYIWDINGSDYMTTGTYIYTENCVEHILELTVNQPTIERTVATSCGMYIWDSGNLSDYFETGTYSYIENCVEHILELTVNQPTIERTVATSCGMYIWETGNLSDYFETGTYSYIENCVEHILELTINNNTIISQPVNATICKVMGGTTSLSVATSGTSLTYKWFTQALATATTGAWSVVANNSNYFGATTATLNITKTTLTLPATGTKYKVEITDSCGTITSNIVSITDFTVLSKAAAVTVVEKLSPLLTTCQGNSVNLSLAAGSIGNIQWQSSTDGITYNNVGDSIAQSALSATNLAMPFNTGALTQSTWFRVIASNGVCNAAVGTAIKITVSAPVTTGTISGGDITVCAPLAIGFDASGTALTTAITNSTLLTLTDFTEGATILWQKSTNYTATTPIWSAAGSTTTTFTANTLTADTWYRALVTNGACKDYTLPVKITVTKAAKAGAITSAASVCTGGDIMFTSAAYTGASIQWEVSTTSALTGFTPIADANQLTFTMNAVSYAPLSKFYVRNVVTSGNCTLARSAVKTIIVNPLSVPGTVKGGGTICSGSNATLSVAGNTGTIQWQYSLDGVEFKTVPYWKSVATVPTFFNPDNATSFSTATSTGIAATYIATNITTDTYFRAKITSGACSEVYSNVVQYTIGDTAVAGTLIVVNEIVCKGAGTTLTLTGSVGSIKWWKSTNWTSTSPSWTAVTTSTSGTLATGILSVATAYKAEVTIGLCSTETSQVVPVMVYSTPLAKTITANVTSPSGASSTLAICNTSTSKVLTIGAGSVGAIQWQRSSTSATSGFVDIADATATSYSVTNPTFGANYFRAKFTNSCGASVFGTAFRVYFKECNPTKTITSSGLGKTPFAVVAFPNPFTNNFNFDVTSSSSENVEVLVYDMIGRLLEKHQENVSEINTLEIGTSYPAGVYNVIVTQGLEVKTVRVIKK